MIAMDIERLWRRLVAREMRLARNADDALARRSGFRRDVAALDFNLGVQSCELIADAQLLGMPFVFASGHGDGVRFPQLFRDVPVVCKPVDAVSIAAKIGQARAAVP